MRGRVDSMGWVKYIVPCCTEYRARLSIKIDLISGISARNGYSFLCHTGAPIFCFSLPKPVCGSGPRAGSESKSQINFATPQHRPHPMTCQKSTRKLKADQYAELIIMMTREVSLSADYNYSTPGLPLIYAEANFSIRQIQSRSLQRPSLMLFENVTRSVAQGLASRFDYIRGKSEI